MKKANVYFTNMRVRPEGRNLQQKLAFLIRRAGMDEIDFKDRFAAIKIHFGEAGNLSFLRPNFARTVADEIKARGGKPFLTDCNTLYVGSRKHALEHIETAYINGFTPYSTGCHIIIGDGLKGTDDIAVPVPNGEFVREAKIGRGVMDADIFISLNHFKGHEMTGFGGAVKNIGMAAAPAPVKWSSTATANRPWNASAASAAAPAHASAPTARRRSATAGRRSTTRNASAAGAASASARKTPSCRPGGSRRDFWTAKWPSTPLPSSTAGRTSTSAS